jgi:hypothetical protein
MRNLVPMKSMLLFASLSLSSCATTKAIDDSYCYLYRPLITQKGDAAGLKSVPLSQRQIILGNEQIFRQNCGPKS